MKTKRLPLGICDHCEKPFPPGVSLYTKRGPRLYCSIDCRNTANSRAGAPIRARKARERVRRGEWQNPIHLEDPESRREHARTAGRKGRQAEVEAGTWRNPALEPEAREKLSRPRKHADNPVLHSAIEKLSRGASVTDLTPEEQEAHRAYRVISPASAAPRSRPSSARPSAPSGARTITGERNARKIEPGPPTRPGFFCLTSHQLDL